MKIETKSISAVFKQQIILCIVDPLLLKQYKMTEKFAMKIAYNIACDIKLTIIIIGTPQQQQNQKCVNIYEMIKITINQSEKGLILHSII